MDLCNENRDLYLRRRAPMTKEVRDIKDKARKDGEAKAIEDWEANARVNGEAYRMTRCVHCKTFLISSKYVSTAGLSKTRCRE